jgi:hypothetical protein
MRSRPVNEMSSNKDMVNFRLKIVCEACGAIHGRLDEHTCDIDVLVAKYVTPHLAKEA